MLYAQFQEPTLYAHLCKQESFHPYPVISERESWDSLPEELRKAQVQRGEKHLNESYPALSATLYLEFVRNGNRARYEAACFKRRTMLCELVLAECVENQGRFLDQILDGIWAVCEETSWCIPAHKGVEDPLSAELKVDLFAAETGALLAWILYLIGDRLDEISLAVRSRIVSEVKERILEPAMEKDFPWMGFQGGHPNNWNPWICSNWLAALLILEEDDVKRQHAVSRIMRALDNFIEGYPDDGACDEGPGYWFHAAGSLLDCLELLYHATDGVINVFDEPLIKNMGVYIYGAQVAGKWVVNFADAPARANLGGSVVFRYGKAVGDTRMMGLAARETMELSEGVGGKALNRALSGLFMVPEMQNTTPDAPLPRQVWWDKRQILIARDREGDESGFCLAAKGGHNDESHNHNDVGQFICFLDGQPLLIDAGVETYTRQTFSPDRYSIWTMQSAWHNLPTINGYMQVPGDTAAAQDVTCDMGDKEVCLSMDIAGAYPDEAGLASWRRSFRLVRGREVIIEDNPSFTEEPDELYFTLLTPCSVEGDEENLYLNAQELPCGEHSASGSIKFPKGRLRPEIEKVPITDEKLKKIWGNTLCRVRLFAEAPASKDPYEFRIQHDS